jgi:hypothetical protein
VKAAKAPPEPALIETARVVVDILSYVREGTLDRRRLPPEQSDDINSVVLAAIAEYLRQYPKARSKGYPWLQVPSDGELDFVCLFCRESINTLSGKTSSAPPAAFWEKLYKHCALCAAFFLAGMTDAEGPGRRRMETLVPLAKLRGAALKREAKAALAYLGLAYPRGRQTMATMRSWISAARSIAKLRATNDEDIGLALAELPARLGLAPAPVEVNGG